VGGALLAQNLSFVNLTNVNVSGGSALPLILPSRVDIDDLGGGCVGLRLVTAAFIQGCHFANCTVFSGVGGCLAVWNASNVTVMDSTLSYGNASNNGVGGCGYIRNVAFNNASVWFQNVSLWNCFGQAQGGLSLLNVNSTLIDLPISSNGLIYEGGPSLF